LTARISPPNLATVQCLRGVAAMLVVLFHAHGAIGIKFPAEPSVLNGFLHFRDLGVVGVDLFFVVSGFIMFYVYSPEFGKPGAMLDFAVRRLIRIVPLYWILTSILVGGLICFPSAFGVLRFSWAHALDSFLFLPTLNSANEPFPVLNSGWTLTYEMYFYLLFAICLGRTPRFALATVALIFIGSVLAGVFLFPGARGPAIGMLVNPILIEFVLGGCLGFAITRKWALPVRTAVLIGGAGCALLLAQGISGMWEHGRVLTRGVPCLLIVAALVSSEIRGNVTVPAWLKRLGDESYSLYLSHVMTGALFFKACAWLSVTRWISVDVLIPAFLVVAVVAGKLVFLALERPLLVTLNRVWRDARPRLVHR
jgi:exopolysaccharide production protein ExoZ